MVQRNERTNPLTGTAGAVSERKKMPLAQIFVPKGALTLEQRREIIKGVTDVLVKAERLPDSGRPFVTVLINEVADGGWGVAGHGYELKEFPQLIAGKSLIPKD
jgi:4-oxalocrotonate tautomerase